MGRPQVRYLAVDPGKCTGYAYDRGAPEVPELAQLPALDFCAEAARLAQDFGPDLTIIWEKFTITAQTLRKAREYHAIEVIGVLKYAAFQHGCVLAPPQQPGDAKKLVTDARLKQLGLYRPGQDHARDAARHLVLHGVRTGRINPEVLDGSDA